MKTSRACVGIILLSLGLMFTTVGCSRASQPLITPAATPTDIAGVLIEPEEEASACTGLSGVITMQVLVGPSEAVGMAPVSVGEIPFTVIEKDGVFALEGGGPLNFDEQVYEAEWGTYTVSFNAETKIHGSCLISGELAMLDLYIVMDGEQIVIVEAEGFHGEYPWEGTREIQVNLPAEDGATESGEGWQVVLGLTP